MMSSRLLLCTAVLFLSSVQPFAATRCYSQAAPDAGAPQPMSRTPIAPKDPLHDAVRRGDARQVQTLLAGRADVNAPDSLGRRPLHYAARLGYLEVVQALLAAGAAVDARDPDGFTPLLRAVQGGHTAAAALLIAGGADVLAATNSGDRPLDIARRQNDKAMIELLQR